MTHFLGVLGLTPAPMPIKIAVAVARENLGDAVGLEARGLPVYRGLLELFVLAWLDMELFSKLLIALLPFIIPGTLTLPLLVLVKAP